MLIPFMILPDDPVPRAHPGPAVTIVKRHAGQPPTGRCRVFAASFRPSPARRLTPRPPSRGRTPKGLRPRLVLWGIRLQGPRRRTSDKQATPVSTSSRVAADFSGHAAQRRDPLDTSPS